MQTVDVPLVPELMKAKEEKELLKHEPAKVCPIG